MIILTIPCKTTEQTVNDFTKYNINFTGSNIVLIMQNLSLKYLTGYWTVKLSSLIEISQKAGKEIFLFMIN